LKQRQVCYLIHTTSAALALPIYPPRGHTTKYFVQPQRPILTL
jgi:hypothetical protein